jgi:muconolactone delta-isomerase
LAVKVLALERKPAGVAPDASDADYRAEARRVWELQQAGLLREIYFRADATQAVLVLECGDLDEARDVVESLPLVKVGAIDFELIPLVPYPGLRRLFDDDSAR